MKFLLIMPICFCFLMSSKTQASSSYQVNSICEGFATGKIDAYRTLEELDIKVDNYSIGVNNTAKILCT